MSEGKKRRINLEDGADEEEKSILPRRYPSDISNPSAADERLLPGRSLLSQKDLVTSHKDTRDLGQQHQQQQEPSAPNYTSTKKSSHSTFIMDPQIRSSFSFRDKASLAAKRVFLCRGNKTYVDHILIPAVTLPDIEKDRFRSKILQVNILETSHLEMDPNVIHPHVKVHIVDMLTGEYLKKTNQISVREAPERTKINALSHFEKLTFVSENKDCSHSDIDFIPPFATNCCDLRISGNTRAKWTDKILINEDCSSLLGPNTLILFELLDFNKKLITEGSKLLDSNLNYRIAWGYIRPIGTAKNHVGFSKVQLFKYKFHPKDPTRANLFKSNRRVPYVYFDFLWPVKRKYDGYLSIQMLLVDRPQVTFLNVESSRNQFEIEGFPQGLNLSKKLQETRRHIDTEDPDYIKKQRVLRKRRRYFDEQCYVPHKVLFRFSTSRLGCMRIAFSPDGRYLAAACTDENSKTVIKIFNIEDGILIYTLKGHKNLVHDLDWSADSQCLISGSSDFDCKIWYIPPEEPSEEVDEEDSEKNHYVYTLSHPSYIYACKFYNEKNQYDRRVVATACFDSKVRLWLLETEYDAFQHHLKVKDVSVQETLVSSSTGKYDKFQNLLDHRHPNCLKFDENGRLYVGDSLGLVHIWDVDVQFRKLGVSKIRTLQHPEYEGDPLNNISLLPYDRRRFILHSRDNCIRNVDYSQQNQVKIISRYFGSKSSKFPIRSCTSPDGQYVLGGSEDGKPYLWDIATGEQEHTDDLQLSWVGPITDVAWNSQYHMVAFSGFGDEYPLLVYCYEKDRDFIEEEKEKAAAHLKQQHLSEGHENVLNSPDDVSRRRRNVIPEEPEESGVRSQKRMI